MTAAAVPCEDDARETSAAPSQLRFGANIVQFPRPVLTCPHAGCATREQSHVVGGCSAPRLLRCPRRPHRPRTVSAGRPRFSFRHTSKKSSEKATFRCFSEEFLRCTCSPSIPQCLAAPTSRRAALVRQNHSLVGALLRQDNRPRQVLYLH